MSKDMQETYASMAQKMQGIPRAPGQYDLLVKTPMMQEPHHIRGPPKNIADYLGAYSSGPTRHHLLRTPQGELVRGYHAIVLFGLNPRELKENSELVAVLDPLNQTKITDTGRRAIG